MMMGNKDIRLITFGLVLFVWTLLNACVNDKSKADLAGADEYYTCSMDPQVIENKSGNCPICHMKLIKVKKNTLKTGQIKLSEQQIKLANVTYDTLRAHKLTKDIPLTGKVAIDQNLANSISSRVQGRIDKLYIKSEGEYIKKGQLIYEIYSEELNTLQSEYILSVEKSVLSFDLQSAAKNKLLLFGMSDSLIQILNQTKNVFKNVPVFAPDDGFVGEISVSEGEYVSSGKTLFRLISLQSMWVEAQVYLPYLQYVHTGTEATFSIPGSDEMRFTGKVIFIDPQVQSPQRYVLARFHVANPTSELKPGMLASIILKTEMKQALALPVHSIIQESTGDYVWIRNTDGVFENRMVTIGMQNSRDVEITEGLKEGDVVVVSGAYLINSEFIFKKGANPMESHQNMPGMKM